MESEYWKQYRKARYWGSVVGMIALDLVLSGGFPITWTSAGVSFAVYIIVSMIQNSLWTPIPPPGGTQGIWEKYDNPWWKVPRRADYRMKKGRVWSYWTYENGTLIPEDPEAYKLIQKIKPSA